MNSKIKLSVIIICCILFTFIAISFIILIEKIRNLPNISKSNPPERLSFQAEAKPANKSKVVTNDRTAPIVRRSLGIFVVTAYCPCKICCEEFADGITASGHIIQPGDKFCAADKAFPFRIKLDIPGYVYVPVLDRGGKIKGNKLDVFFPTHKEALEWGVQELEIHCWVEGD